MSKTTFKFEKIKPNYKGYDQVRKSDGVRDFIKSKANEMQSRCGNGYETDVKYVKTRVLSSVYTATTESKKDNLDNNTLLKAMK